MLLGLSFIGDESCQGADKNYVFIEFVLYVSVKDKSNVMTLVGDNNNTNRAFARLFARVYVGCHSHHFALAVKDEIQEQQVVVNRVHPLMRKLSFSTTADSLRQKTPLAAKCCNVIRWNSAFQMMQRYMKVEKHIEAIYYVEVRDHFPTINENQQVKELLTRLTALNSITT